MNRNGGVARQLDNIGRIVIPVEVRNRLGLEPGTPVEYLADPDTGNIAVRRYVSSGACVICGGPGATVLVAAVMAPVCRDCCRDARVELAKREAAAG